MTRDDLMRLDWHAKIVERTEASRRPICVSGSRSPSRRAGAMERLSVQSGGIYHRRYGQAAYRMTFGVMQYTDELVYQMV